jgi:hypothetical protein
LQDFADKGQNGSAEDDFPASQEVADPGARECAEERTDGECSNDSALNSRLMALLGSFGVDGVDGGKMIVPVAKGEKASDTRLVVAEKHKSRENDEKQLSRLKFLAGKAHSDGTDK